MYIALISLKRWLGVRHMGSPWRQLLGNRSSVCVLRFPKPSDVRRLVHQGNGQKALGCHRYVFGSHNSKPWIIISLHPEPPPLLSEF